MRKPKRLLIVFDGARWYVRRVRVIEHDLDRDEKVYRCDRPVDVWFATLGEAVIVAKGALGQPVTPPRRGTGARGHD